MVGHWVAWCQNVISDSYVYAIQEIEALFRFMLLFLFWSRMVKRFVVESAEPNQLCRVCGVYRLERLLGF